MFNVTEPAAAFMADELSRRETSAKVIRFWHDKRGLHLRLSQPHPDDHSFTYRGRTVFVVDEDLAARLAGRTLDLKHTVGGTKLALTELSPGGND